MGLIGAPVAAFGWRWGLSFAEHEPGGDAVVLVGAPVAAFGRRWGLSFAEHEPGRDAVVLVSTIAGGFFGEIGRAVGGAVEAALVTAGEIDGIDVAVFAQGVGKAPKLSLIHISEPTRP